MFLCKFLLLQSFIRPRHLTLWIYSWFTTSNRSFPRPWSILMYCTRQSLMKYQPTLRTQIIDIYNSMYLELIQLKISIRIFINLFFFFLVKVTKAEQRQRRIFQCEWFILPSLNTKFIDYWIGLFFFSTTLFSIRFIHIVIKTKDERTTQQFYINIISLYTLYSEIFDRKN